MRWRHEIFYVTHTSSSESQSQDRRPRTNIINKKIYIIYSGHETMTVLSCDVQPARILSVFIPDAEPQQVRSL